MGFVSMFPLLIIGLIALWCYKMCIWRTETALRFLAFTEPESPTWEIKNLLWENELTSTQQLVWDGKDEQPKSLWLQSKNGLDFFLKETTFNLNKLLQSFDLTSSSWLLRSGILKKNK